MKHFISLILSFFIVLSMCMMSCKASRQSVERTAEKSAMISHDTVNYVPWDNSLLWEISFPNNQIESSYIFGTIHMIESERFFYPKGTKEALSRTKEVFFEIDMDEMSNVGSQIGMMGKLFMKDGMTLEDLMDEDDYLRVAEFFSDKGLPMMFVNKIKPMFLASMTEMDMESMGMFGKGDEESNIKSYEMELYNLAIANEIEVSGLETMKFQIQLFDGIPYEVQAEMLVQAVEDSGSEESAKMMEELVDVYLSQNIEGLVSTIQQDDSMARYEQMLLTDRNKNWIPIIESKISKQKTFFAVGAGHLAGPNGVLNLLRQKGYTVKPLSVSNE